jgi:hypothetical protein
LFSWLERKSSAEGGILANWFAVSNRDLFIRCREGVHFFCIPKSTQGISLIFADNKQSAIRLKTGPKKKAT